jgi:hypothetical protein
MRHPVVLAVAAVLPFAVACGSYADTSATQLAKDVKSAMGDLTSVHISGAVEKGGSKITIDLSLDNEGDCEGTIQIANAGKVQLIRTGGVSYVKPDASFWKATGAAAVAKRVKGRWVSGDNVLGGLTNNCDLPELLTEFKSSGVRFGKASDTDKVDGKDVVKVPYTSADGSKGTFYVLTDEPHYAVKADLGDGGSLSFSAFDAAVDPKAPAKNQVVDGSTLG